MFKLQNHVPDVYVDESRDFQLFTRIFDVAYNSTKYQIDDLLNTANTSQIDQKLIPLLSYKLGFFDSVELSDRNNRLLLTALPAIFRKKGSIDAINKMIQLYCRMYHTKGKVYKDVGSDIQLVFEGDILNESWLFQLLHYILPTGYQLTKIVGLTDNVDTVVNIVDTLTATIDKQNQAVLSKLPTSDTDIRQTILTLHKPTDK